MPVIITIIMAFVMDYHSLHISQWWFYPLYIYTQHSTHRVWLWIKNWCQDSSVQETQEECCGCGGGGGWWRQQQRWWEGVRRISSKLAANRDGDLMLITQNGPRTSTSTLETGFVILSLSLSPYSFLFIFLGNQTQSKQTQILFSM